MALLHRRHLLRGSSATIRPPGAAFLWAQVDDIVDARRYA